MRTEIGAQAVIHRVTGADGTDDPACRVTGIKSTRFEVPSVLDELAATADRLKMALRKVAPGPGGRILPLFREDPL